MRKKKMKQALAIMKAKIPDLKVGIATTKKGMIKELWEVVDFINSDDLYRYQFEYPKKVKKVLKAVGAFD